MKNALLDRDGLPLTVGFDHAFRAVCAGMILSSGEQELYDDLRGVHDAVNLTLRGDFDPDVLRAKIAAGEVSADYDRESLLEKLEDCVINAEAILGLIPEHADITALKPRLYDLVYQDWLGLLTYLDATKPQTGKV